MSRSSLTVDVWPFIAASIRGVIPNLLPVPELMSAPALNTILMIFTWPAEAARERGM
jgi:hypothetical protein